MELDQEQLTRQADVLYDRYVRSLEPAHWGEFVAVSPSGETLLGSSAHDVLSRASEAFGTGNFIFKVGEKAVGRWQ